jgi:bifunctional non-homologous end joining protein LigD
MKTRQVRRQAHNWLLIKHRDEAAKDTASGWGSWPTEDRSIASGRTMVPDRQGQRARRATPFMTASETRRRRGLAEPSKTPSDRGRPDQGSEGQVGGDPRQKGGQDLPRLRRAAALQVAGEAAIGQRAGLHEIKFDGYRMQLRVSEGGKAKLLQAPARVWTGRPSSPAIKAAAAGLPDSIIDGEVCALDHSGAPDFAALQAAISDGKTDDLIFFVFDLLFDGRRGPAPPAAVASQGPAGRDVGRCVAANALRYVDHFITAGDAVLQSACRMDLEGIISKRLDAPYRSGRGETWAKSKCRAGHEVVIGGYTTTGAPSAR